VRVALFTNAVNPYSVAARDDAPENGFERDRWNTELRVPQAVEKFSGVIPGLREAAGPESTHIGTCCFWIPGSRLRRAPE
jgi:hypothetical protein